MSLTVHLALVSRVFNAVAVMVIVCGRHGIGHVIHYVICQTTATACQYFQFITTTCRIFTDIDSTDVLRIRFNVANTVVFNTV